MKKVMWLILIAFLTTGAWWNQKDEKSGQPTQKTTTARQAQPNRQPARVGQPPRRQTSPYSQNYGAQQKKTPVVQRRRTPAVVARQRKKAFAASKRVARQPVAQAANAPAITADQVKAIATVSEMLKKDPDMLSKLANLTKALQNSKAKLAK